MEDSEKFIWLLMQENNNCIHWIGNYIYSAMKTMKKVLEDTTSHPRQSEQLIFVDICCQIAFTANSVMEINISRIFFFMMENYLKFPSRFRENP